MTQIAPTTRKQDAAALLLQRRKSRQSLNDWARWNDFEPAAHHQLINEELEKVVRGENKKLAIFCPPGSAKSTYASVLFPPWFLAQRSGAAILSCSHSFTLAERFGKRCRNIIEHNSKVLGYSLAKDSQAAGDWGTSNGGVYFAAGVGAGIAGHRADLGLIDDPIGSQEDADSVLVRDKQWDWYINDFFPRLKPNAAQVLIMNRRHEEDLAGRLLESGDWKVIKLPFFAKENDPIGRPIGQRLWPEWFTREMEVEIRKLPSRVQAGLYGQEPAPEEGNFFKASWLQEYTMDELPRNLRIYVGSDHACSEEQEEANDLTCLIPVGVDEEDDLWILPDVWWKRDDTFQVVEAMLDMGKRRQPLAWWAEKGQISKSIGPFLFKRMAETKTYFCVEQVVPVRDKRTRAQAIHGRMSMHKVHFPGFAHWWPAARHELLMFPAGKHDDFVDALAHVGREMHAMTRPSRPKAITEVRPFTVKWIKESARWKNSFNREKVLDF